MTESALWSLVTDAGEAPSLRVFAARALYRRLKARGWPNNTPPSNAAIDAPPVMKDNSCLESE